MNNIKLKSVTTVVIGLISAFVFGYVGSQKLGALTTGIIGILAITSGAITLLAQQPKPRSRRLHVQRGAK
ncbi:hypothetical protein WKK05_41285 (plasmid) [Nostoc sp. UHCC 0302]|uniref:hypothetical protein n=1 Tax=Nostoc sp. UHCC 0302 TaxID=3134896 RepID=UPI00311CCA83